MKKATFMQHSWKLQKNANLYILWSDIINKEYYHVRYWICLSKMRSNFHYCRRCCKTPKEWTCRWKSNWTTSFVNSPWYFYLFLTLVIALLNSILNVMAYVFLYSNPLFKYQSVHRHLISHDSHTQQPNLYMPINDMRYIQNNFTFIRNQPISNYYFLI
jgi:hypothetical protein